MLKHAWDVKGRWVDNVFVQRLWRSVKHVEVYFWIYDSIGDVLLRYADPTIPYVGISH